MTSRQESIRSLPTLAAVLLHADAAEGSDTPRIRSAVQAAVSAECVQCGIVISGDELLALASAESPNPPPPPATLAKLQRLRLGYCARSNCNSAFYRIALPDIPGLDWRRILPADELAPPLPTTTPEPDEAALARRAESRERTRLTLIRGALGLFAIVILLVARHWYRGGSIPLLREPEEFQVDVDPIYQTTNPRHR